LRIVDGGETPSPAAEVSEENGTATAPFQNEKPPSATLPEVTDEPPSELPAEIAEEWRRVVADLRGRHLWKDSMAGMVSAYVLAQATAMRLEIKIASEGESVPGAGGAQKPHPATGLLRSSRETVARLGGDLGISPSARSRKALRSGADPDLFTPRDEFDL
jgi:P27 family predicted phage terminase small subunit